MAEDKKVKPVDDKKVYAGKKLADAGIAKLGAELTVHSVAAEKLIASGKAFESKEAAEASGKEAPAAPAKTQTPSAPTK